MQTQPNAERLLGSVAAVITHEVEDFDAWKRAFDAHATSRRAAAITATHINRHASEPNRLSVYLEGTDAGKLEAFLTSNDVMTVMRDAGVKGPPHLVSITPVEDLCVKNRPLAGAIIRHEVSDYDAWKKAFDAHAEQRGKAGIIGHAVNRMHESPNVVVVYLQAESLEALQAFASAPDLKKTMDVAGVIGAPDVTFVHGGEWAT